MVTNVMEKQENGRVSAVWALLERGWWVGGIFK